jgi:hypothetical protein
MPNRNPNKPHRHIAANERKTQQRVEQYYGKVALLATWENQPDDVQIRNHSYLLALRREIRNVKNYIMHRADPNAEI